MTAALLKQRNRRIVPGVDRPIRRLMTAALLKHYLSGPGNAQACNYPPSDDGGPIEAIHWLASELRELRLSAV